jgi:hypothetical protein
MADRTQALTTVKGGINRQRTKGGALKDSLYDLVNGYVSKSKTIVPRPGTRRIFTLPTDTAGNSLTKGLMAFEGELHVFATELVDTPPGVVLHVITHPDSTIENIIAIEEINFAAPFLGYIYVVATFENGDTYHFWLQGGDPWSAETIYGAGDIITPSVPTGLSYQASRLTPANLSWAPNVERTVGEVVEPTVYNDYYYTVVDTQGTTPRSGAVEPIWPTEDGAQVTEDADGVDTTPVGLTNPPDLTKQPSQAVIDRYINQTLGS